MPEPLGVGVCPASHPSSQFRPATARLTNSSRLCRRLHFLILRPPDRSGRTEVGPSASGNKVRLDEDAAAAPGPTYWGSRGGPSPLEPCPFILGRRGFFVGAPARPRVLVVHLALLLRVTRHGHPLGCHLGSHPACHCPWRPTLVSECSEAGRRPSRSPAWPYGNHTLGAPARRRRRPCSYLHTTSQVAS